MYLDNTTLNDIQGTDAFNEKRIGKHGLIDLAKASTASVDYIPPSIKQKLATMPSDMAAYMPVIKDQEVTVVTTPGFDYIPINQAETAKYSFVPFDVFSGMRINPASFEGNMVDGVAYRNSVLKNIFDACATEIEGIISTQLAARKTQLLDFTSQISQGDGTFTFNGSTDTLEINKAAQKDTLFPNLAVLMEANKLGGEYRIATSPAGLHSGVVEALKYGAANEKNLAWAQSLGLDRQYESHSISTSANFDGYFVRDGEIGIYENFPWDFRNGTNFAGKKWSISDMELPFVKLRANIYTNTEATEATSLVNNSNMKMTHFEEMAIWFRFYLVYRYNSDLSTRPNGIVKLTGLTT